MTAYPPPAVPQAPPADPTAQPYAPTGVPIGQPPPAVPAAPMPGAVPQPGAAAAPSKEALMQQRLAHYQRDAVWLAAAQNAERAKSVAEATIGRWTPAIGVPFTFIANDFPPPEMRITDKTGKPIESFDGCTRYRVEFAIDDETGAAGPNGKTFEEEFIVSGVMTAAREKALKAKGHDPSKIGSLAAAKMKQLIEYGTGVENAPEVQWPQLVIQDIILKRVRFVGEMVKPEKKKGARNEPRPYLRIDGVVAPQLGAPPTMAPPPPPAAMMPPPAVAGQGMPPPPGQMPPVQAAAPPMQAPTAPALMPVAAEVAQAGAFVVQTPVGNLPGGDPRVTRIQQLGNAVGVNPFAAVAGPNGSQVPQYATYEEALAAIAQTRGLAGAYPDFDSALAAVEQAFGI